MKKIIPVPVSNIANEKTQKDNKNVKDNKKLEAKKETPIVIISFVVEE